MRADREAGAARAPGAAREVDGAVDAPVGDAAGPMIAACTGHRCAALWRLQAESSGDGGTGGMAGVRQAVRSSRGAVLTGLECVGACAQGPLVGVADRRAGCTRTSEVTWLVGAAEPGRQAGLVAWIASDWSEGAAPAPEVLRPWLFRMHRHAR